MEYYTLAGMVAISLIAYLGIYFTIRKNVKEDTESVAKSKTEEIKALNSLNVEIVKLTEELQAIHKRDENRDKRLDEHGKEIDSLRLKTESHEIRIHNLEERK